MLWPNFTLERTPLPVGPRLIQSRPQSMTVISLVQEGILRYMFIPVTQRFLYCGSHVPG